MWLPSMATVRMTPVASMAVSDRARDDGAVRADRHARRSTDFRSSVYARSENAQGTIPNERFAAY
jgi:hypothetical protein